MSSPATRRVTALQLESGLTPHLVFLNYNLPFQDRFSLSPTFAGILNIVTCRWLSFSEERSLICELLPFFLEQEGVLLLLRIPPNLLGGNNKENKRLNLKHNAEIWRLRTLLSSHEGLRHPTKIQQKLLALLLARVVQSRARCPMVAAAPGVWGRGWQRSHREQSPSEGSHLPLFSQRFSLHR